PSARGPTSPTRSPTATPRPGSWVTSGALVWTSRLRPASRHSDRSASGTGTTRGPDHHRGRSGWSASGTVGSEPPTRRTGRVLRGTDCGCRAGLDLVDEPRRRTERRRVERRGDAGSHVVRAGGPPALRPQGRDLGHDRGVGDAP